MLNALICGAGNIAQGFDSTEGDEIFTHVKAYTRHGGFHVAAIIDADAEKAKQAAARWNILRYGACLADVRDVRADVVSICTPDHTHAAYLREALALKPKLVFCEKPLTASTDEAFAITAAYADANVLLAVNYSRRWLPQFQELSREARAGTFGSVVSARMKYYKGFRHNASHFVDLLEMFCSPDVLASAIIGEINDYAPDDPTISLAARMKSGIGSRNEFALMVEGYDSRQMSPQEFEIVFENTSVRFEELNGSFLTVARLRENAAYAGFYEFSERTTTQLSHSEVMKYAIASLHNALDRGAALASTGATALQTLRLVEQMRQPFGSSANY